MSDLFKLAAVATGYFRWSHADVIVSRWFEHRETDAAWGWPGPKSRIVSLYVDTPFDMDLKRPDLSGQAAKKYGIPLCTTVEAGLTLQSGKLAVDGVLLIGEHGRYPVNKFGQKLYPRKQLFDRIVNVFEKTGRSVPVFCDKHYSYRTDWAIEMIETARKMGFLLFGGSSLPVCPRRPPLKLNANQQLLTGVAVLNGGREAYGYHSLEFVQQMLEEAGRGMTGIASITALIGDAVWQEFDSGRWAIDLLEAAIAVQPKIIPGDMRANIAAKQPVEAFIVEYRDGLRIMHVNAWGQVESWSVAFRTADDPVPKATATVSGGPEDYFAHFGALSAAVEKGLRTGKSPWPLGRSYLTTAATNAMSRAFGQPGIPLLTPELFEGYSLE